MTSAIASGSFLWSRTIPVIAVGNRRAVDWATLHHGDECQARQPVRTPVSRCSAVTSTALQRLLSSMIYVLNAAALSEPYAVEHLAADLSSYSIDVVVITETHLKSKHTAYCFNQHYASISSDTMYVDSLRKQSANPSDTDFISEWSVFQFQMLNKVLPTATGMDKLLAWFLCLGAHVFCRPLAYSFNKSLATSIVPREWKSAQIHSIP